MKYSKLYDLVYGKRDFKTILGYIFKKFPGRKFKTLYDFGSGTGLFTEEALQYFNKVYAIEVDNQAIEQFKIRCPEVEISTKIEPYWQSPDLITLCFNVVNYMTKSQLKDFFATLKNKISRESVVYLDCLMEKEIRRGTFKKRHDVVVSGINYQLVNKLTRKHDSKLASFYWKRLS